MFFPEDQVRVHVYGRPVDMRKSFDGLYALTRQELAQDPLNGRLFIFINRRATQVKVLYWNHNGRRRWPDEPGRSHQPGPGCPAAVVHRAPGHGLHAATDDE